MQYPLAERFHSIQGEGKFCGVPMAFLRVTGCSVSKRICSQCDTDFEKMDRSKGGGLYTVEDIVGWVADYKHVCITGGEPLDRNLEPLIIALAEKKIYCHIETSGTKSPDWLWRVRKAVWLCVSPKPGYLIDMVTAADEVKVILQGLGVGEGWLTLDHARAWAGNGQLVYIQPRNHKHTVSRTNLQEAIDTVLEYPELRLSVQMHKFIETR